MSCDSNDFAIEVSNLSKTYQLYSRPVDRLYQMLGSKKKKRYEEFSALDNISFQLSKGDCVGVLGHNGAGKSTLLQIITGTLTPSSGVVKVRGRVAALLELGAGFNPEFTGKENVYMNAAILGLSTEEIDSKYDRIIEFAEIGDFIDRPVKSYSSGMYVRLAFSVAIHTDPEILIIDEALAVGDIRFQIKCIKYMESLKSKGVTILFVTHAPEQVQRFCNKALWLDKGHLKSFDRASSVCDSYRDFMSRSTTPTPEVVSEMVQESNVSNVTPAKPARILSTSLNENKFSPLDSLILEIEYEVFDISVPSLLVGAAIISSSGEFLFGPNTYLEHIEIPTTRGIHKVLYKLPKLTLLPGEFWFDVGVFSDKGLVTIDYLPRVQGFKVESEYKSEGVFYIEHEWEVKS
ncbi:lipopolysaccharide transport system ATP-binding protein [Marinomonas communis]|uniref:Lipopolysaccharide transport system ATP-binding protein n=1 Tax=Marinomonas communis TaxID=28254 RepID=A0A4R6X2J0_9GAMM|nr:lipopolysaccharide transport system ATP-binding protein [Marinomonas communis]